jgi:integrase
VSLRWPNVDLERRRVHVVEFVFGLGYDMVPSAGKSRDAVRTVDLDDGLVRVLRAQRKLQAEERLVAADTSRASTCSRARGAPIPPGEPVQAARTDDRRGGPAEGDRPRPAPHRRDAHARQRVPPKVAAERLGHADPTLFTNLYSHITPTMQREAAEKIGAALFD